MFTQRKPRIVPALLIGSMLGLIAGCGGAGGSRPPMGKVSGKVLVDGKPLTTGSITFIPITGKGGETGQNAMGDIGPDGSFTLTTFDTDDGAILGQHKAIIIAHSAPPSDIDPSKGVIPSMAGPNGYKPPKPLVPEKYTNPEDTPLKYTVREGKNDFTVEVKDE
jgi:hypothetical protein